MLQKIKKLESFIPILLIINGVLFAFPKKFKAYPVLLLLFISFYIFNKNKSKINLKMIYKILIISTPFCLYLLSSLVFNSFNLAYNKLATMSSLIVYPLIFSLLKSSGVVIYKKWIVVFFKVFIIVTILFSLITFIYFWNLEYTFSETIIHYSNVINIRLGLFSIHPIYNSLIIGIAILMLITLFYKTNNIFSKFIYVLCFCFLVVFLSILMRKGPIISLLVCMGVLCYFLYGWKATFLGVFVLFILISLFITYLPKYENFNRFEELYKTDRTNSVVKKSTIIREIIYNCSIEKIIESPVLGYGVGKVQKKLNSCYNEKKLDISTFEYNSHNQFLSVTLNFGLLGLVIYVSSLVFMLKKFFKQGNGFGFVLLLFFVFCFLTENIIEREIGVMAFSFCISLFYINDDLLVYN